MENYLKITQISPVGSIDGVLVEPTVPLLL